MQRLQRNIFLSFSLILVTLFSFGQADTSVQKKDSLSNVILQDFQEKISDFEQQRIEDSIQKKELENQLNSLTTADNLKRAELERKLREIENEQVQLREKKRAHIDSLRANAIGYPVKGFFDDTLFLVYTNSGSFSARDRAVAISDRIHKIEHDINFKNDTINITRTDNSVDLIFKETTIVSVSENDAIWNNSSRAELAQEYKNIINDAIKDYRDEHHWVTVLKKLGLVLLVLLALITLIVLTNRLFKWIAKKIIAQRGRLFKGIVLKNYTLVDAKSQVGLALNVNGIIRWIFIILIAYFALPVLFGIFRWTRNFAETLFGYILNPLKKIGNSFLDYLPNLITIIVIIIVFRYILKAIRFFKKEIESGTLTIPGFYPDWANPTFQIVKVLVYAFMFVVIFPYLPGSDSPVFKGVSVFLGFLFTFGSAGSLSNIISGIVLTYMRLFKIGDRVQIGDTVGDVVEKSLLVTRIRTTKNELISIPNSQIMGNKTINFSSDAPEKGLIIHSTVTIGYDVPWRNMHQALIDAALKTDSIESEPTPFVLQKSLDDFYVSYEINAYTKQPNKQARIYSSLHQNIQDVCNERGIEIMSPHYRAERDGNQSTIPAEYLEKTKNKG